MIGVIAVAPALGVPTTEDAGDYGGNLDLREIGPGATLLLPVCVDDALLVLGDCHAAQGDGELSAAALEMPARVTLRIDLRRGAQLPGPRIERDDEIAAVAVASQPRGGRRDGLRPPRALDRVRLGHRRAGRPTRCSRRSAGSASGYFRLGVVAAKISRRYLVAAARGLRA